MHPDVQQLKDELTDLRLSIDALADRSGPEMMTKAFSMAFRAVRDDAETEAKFVAWSRKFHDDPETAKRAYNSLSIQATDGLARWIGNRVLTIIGAAVIAGALWWWVASQRGGA